MSGAIKNMFGCVIGLRKQHIHNVFLGDAARFGRAIADIYSVIPADFSFLDLTSVSDGESDVARLAGSPAARTVTFSVLAGTMSCPYGS